MNSKAMNRRTLKPAARVRRGRKQGLGFMGRFWTPPVILSLLLMSGWCQSGSGQIMNQVFDNIRFESYEENLIQLGSGGRIYPTKDIERRPAIPHELRVLQSEALREEMELSDSQWSELQKLLEQIEERFEYRPASEKGKQSPGTSDDRSKEPVQGARKDKGKIADPNEESELIKVRMDIQWQDDLKKRFDDIILPHQQQRIRELLIRFQIRGQGFFRYFMLNDDRNGRYDAIWQRLNRESTRLGEELNKKSLEAKAEAINQLLAVFPEDRHPAIQKKLEGFLRLSPDEVDFGVFVWQLGLAEEQSAFWSKRKPDKYHGVMWSVLIFRAFEDGTFAPRGRTGQLPRNLFERSLSKGLMTMVNSPEIQGPLGMSQNQILQLDMLGEEMREKQAAIVAKYDAMRQATGGVKSAWDEKMLADSTMERDSLWNPVIGKIEAILLPEQRDELDRLLDQNRLTTLGMAKALMDEEVGKELGISDNERTRLQETARRVRKQLMEKSLEMEEWLHGEVIGLMKVKQQEEFRELIGEPPRSGSANIDMLVRHLTRNYR